MNIIEYHWYHHWLQTSFKQPSTKSTYHRLSPTITYHFCSPNKKNTPTKQKRRRNRTRSDTSATGRGFGSPGGPSAAALGPGWPWARRGRRLAPGAGGASGGWPRRVAGAVDAKKKKALEMWFWFGVDHGKMGMELWNMMKNADGIMKNWDLTMRNGDKSQSNLAISSSKIAIESDRKLRLNLWRSWLDIQNLWLASNSRSTVLATVILVVMFENTIALIFHTHYK